MILQLAAFGWRSRYHIVPLELWGLQRVQVAQCVGKLNHCDGGREQGGGSVVSFYRFMPRRLDSSIDIEWWNLQFELPAIIFAGG